MREVNIGPASEFADPGRKLIGFERFEVAVFKLGGEFHAYLNHCPHMGGPACQGKMIAKVEEVIAEDRTSKGMTFSKSKMHVVCPWHGFEFDIRYRHSSRQSEGAAAADEGRGHRRRRDRHRAGRARADAGDAGRRYSVSNTLTAGLELSPSHESSTESWPVATPK
jgi:nitrite reductase/ring-hydroxylating ferredoxin subunit